MKSTVIWDTEFLAAEGSSSRYWMGPFDPDPVLVQIGAVRLGLEGDFPVLGQFERLVVPLGREREPLDIPDFFTKLTGLTRERIHNEGLALATALEDLVRFVGSDDLWSWGRDEYYAIAISCFVAGIQSPLPVTRFGNATRLMVAAGMPYEDIKKTRSNGLAAYFGVGQPEARAHDGLDDAMSISLALQELLRTGKLSVEAFDPSAIPLDLPA